MGLKRAEILSAQVNGITLAVLAVVFVIEAVRRLLNPPEVPGGTVAVVAAIGIVVNLAAARLLARAERRSLNIQGAYWHIVTDLAAFAATLVAGLVIVVTGWNQADAVAALFVAALMAVAAYRLLRDSARIFLEASPRGIDPAAVEAAVRGLDGVTGVHELHVWEVTSGFPALSAHVLVDTAADCHERRVAIETLLGGAVRDRPHHLPGRPPRRGAPDLRARPSGCIPGRTTPRTETSRPHPCPSVVAAGGGWWRLVR